MPVVTRNEVYVYLLLLETLISVEYFTKFVLLSVMGKSPLAASVRNEDRTVYILCLSKSSFIKLLG